MVEKMLNLPSFITTKIAYDLNYYLLKFGSVIIILFDYSNNFYKWNPHDQKQQQTRKFSISFFLSYSFIHSVQYNIWWLRKLTIT